jgi:peptidoglycan/xylan/chitin deacetylase (PgdA/CDA1 family)
LGKGGRKGLRKLLRIANKAVNPYWTFKKIVSLEDSYEANSTFFMMGLAPGDEDFNYLVEDMSPELGLIADSGSEIGLHGGHKAFMSLERIIEERKRLEEAAGRPVAGYRNHFLKIRVPSTWRLLEKAGFDYDSTLGYPDAPGFRNGMCHPFHPYDLEEQRELNLLELPLAFMDVALLDRRKPDVGQAWESIKDMIDRTRKCSGVATIIWHNDKMGKEYGKLYEKTIGYCRDSGAWMTSGANISKWWRKNGWIKSG